LSIFTNMEDTFLIGILRFLGRMHPLVVHFPIGLLVVGLFLELLSIGGRRPGLKEGTHWMVYIGVLSAFLSTVLGLLLRNFDAYSGDLVHSHQVMGIITTALGILTTFLLFLTRSGKLSNHLAYRIALAITVSSLTVTGHLGANLTHGQGFLTKALYGTDDIHDKENVKILLSELNMADSLSESQQEKLNMEVRAIFAHNCYQCHSEDKQKGGLILDNKKGVFDGGESGAVIVAGNPEQSELYSRITLSPDHEKVMPQKGKVLQKSEIDLIRLWIKNDAYWADGVINVFPEAKLALEKPDLPANMHGQNPVDILIQSYFEKNGIDWPTTVDDRTFIRRAYLDITGLLPEPAAVNLFIDDLHEDKRLILIEDLLKDHRNYSQHWLSFWNDLLRNDYSGTGFITGGRKQITDWLYRSLMENKPYDLMIRELMNPTPESEGFIKGIQWRGVVNSSQRTEMQAAQNIGQSLMGVNVKCASCHNSFVSNLTLGQAYGFAAIFADSALELNRCDKPLGKMAEVNFLYPELGSVDANTVKERLEMLSEVMVKPENGRLYRTVVNRIWKKLLGRGIIEPVDEMDNSPWSPELLDWLAADFIESEYDLKHLVKIIMTSQAYQLAAVKYDDPEALKTAKYQFRGPVLRRLSAEQFSDAVSKIIAPVYHSVAYDPERNGLSSERVWHRERKYDRDVLPEPGKRYFRHLFTLPDKQVQFAHVIISVDHAYTLYLNDKNVSTGVDWRKVDKLDVTHLLASGKNIIAIEGINEGNLANPAGILFALKIIFHDGEDRLIQSGKDWLSTDTPPENTWTKVEYDDKDWINVRNYGRAHWDNLVNFSFETDRVNFARASLVKQDPFMQALGRPSRENVATSRDEQATLLQALELTNGNFFNNVLAEGADLWIKQYGANSARIGENLYLKSFGRKPTREEEKSF
jgi:uncharacterized membrane protein/mono/diheme cytochrome c family protein